LPPRPAHFTEAPVIRDVRDDAPIPVPRRLDPVKETRLTEAYIERPMIEALNPTRAAEAGDVNAMDEVPRSTWFSPAEAEALADDTEPPAPPFALLDAAAVTREHAIGVSDAHGRSFELWRDPADRPEMATGAAAVTSRLLRAIGYYTPGVFTADLSPSDFKLRDAKDRAALEGLFRSGPRPSRDRYRVAITRWPIGADIGPTPPSGRRDDDGNDRVPHEDRRTLRAFKLIFGWLGMTETDASVLRDAYVGAPGRGHVVHYIAGLGGALGADAVVRPTPPKDDDSDLASQNVWVTLGTLGLYQQKPRLTPRRWPALGEYRERWFPPAFHTSPPIEPMDRMLPSDAYWAAKRIAALETPVLVRALDAGRYHDPGARAALLELLRVRQAIAIRWGVNQVSPCEVERLDVLANPPGAVLVVRDEAPALGLFEGAKTFRTELADEAGRPVAEPSEVRMAGGTLFPVRLPWSAPEYVVVRVWAFRKGVTSPRAMEAHIVHRGDEWKLVGIVH
jgi:hypothetical protein